MTRRLASLCFLLFSLSVSAETIHGLVVGIADGDTITLRDTDNKQHKIRLGGIDAPERGQPYGNVSRQHLSDLAFGKMAKVDCYKTDRYGREVCNVYVDDKDVGLAQIEAGLAWWFRKYAQEQSKQQASQYLAAESRAGMNKVGLWRDAKPVPPWEWRRISP